MYKFKRNLTWLKTNHYLVLSYMLNWIFGKYPPESVELENQKYYWFSVQKIADDTNMSYAQVKRILSRLKNKDSSINYNNQESLLESKIIYSERNNKAYFKLNYKMILEILENNSTNKNIIAKIKEVSMPALFEIENENKVNSNADKIAKKIITENSDIFKTKIGDTKTYANCCKIIQDIYNGNFLNPRIYKFSKLNFKWFDGKGWKDKINSVKKDYGKVEKLLTDAVKNYRLMFDKNYMPFRKDCLPDSFEKWLYNSMNDEYASYFIFSLNKPNPNGKQLSEIKAEKIYNKLPETIQKIGNYVLDNSAINNKSVFWQNLRNLYGWCEWLFTSDINQNLDYWVTSPSEIITKFVDYCEDHNVVLNESTFNVRNSLNNNAPFAWFISEATIEHKLSKEILKSCA